MNRKMLAAIGTGIVAYGAWKKYQSGRSQRLHTSGLTQAGSRDRIDEASYESFPASDAPSWSGATAPGIDRHR